jgi:hypothetical protein
LDPARRASWWEVADAELARLRLLPGRIERLGKRPGLLHLSPDIVEKIMARRRFWDEDLHRIELTLRARIRRPRPETCAKVLEAARREAAAEEAARVSAMMITSCCWNILQVPPGSSARRIKQALAEGKERLRRVGAGLDAFRELETAGLEAINRLASGVW